MNFKQELKDRFGVPENWDKYDYQTKRYSFDDMHEVLESIVNDRLSLPLAKCKCGQNTLPYKAQIEIDKCSRCGNDR